MSTSSYRGRFAPSPTGDLHFGSLVAAVASYADAKQHGGSWLVRIDDVDATRTRPDAESRILASLEQFGLRSDELPERQSDRTPRYQAALERLAAGGHAYRCACSRKAIAASARSGKEGLIYPGTCRTRPPQPQQAAAWRFLVDQKTVTFADRVVGEVQQQLVEEIGDFVIFRLDGFCAYQLAVVIDDADQGITHVVRGADLLWSTPRQIALQRALDLPSPRYAHIPLVYDREGRKLSKRDAAHPIDTADPLPALRAAWRHLHQPDAPVSVRNSRDFWQFAVQTWSLDRLSNHPLYCHDRCPL